MASLNYITHIILKRFNILDRDSKLPQYHHHMSLRLTFRQETSQKVLPVTSSSNHQPLNILSLYCIYSNRL